MGLRKINREREGDRGLFGFLPGRKAHFAKLKKRPSKEEHLSQRISKPAQVGGRAPTPLLNKRLLTILLIILITITIIYVEISLWASKGVEQSTPLGVPTANETLENRTQTLLNTTETKKPDLSLGEPSLSEPEITVGDSVVISAEISNEGEADSNNFSVMFYVGDKLFKTVELGSLDSGDEVDVSATWDSSEGYLGRQNLRIKVDASEEIDESVETNNEKGVTVVVEEEIVEDISASFTKKSVIDITGGWYSDKYSVPPASGPNYVYFQIFRESSDLYYLDVVIAGYKAINQNGILEISIPDSSSSGWNSRGCVKRTVRSDTCVWYGPVINLKLDFDGRSIEVSDPTGKTSSASTSDGEIKEVELAGMRYARWPDEIRTFRVYGGPEPDELVPDEFYGFDGGVLTVYPMRWNPRSHEAEVATWLRFEITTK